MSGYRKGLLAFASLLPVALATPASAQAPDDNKTTATRLIGMTEVTLDRCHWYNFHQSISLWPNYMACGGKSAMQWREFHHTDVNKTDGNRRRPGFNYSTNSLDLLGRQKSDPARRQFTGFSLERNLTLSLAGSKPGDKTYERSPWAWFNYIHSRLRTPLYLQNNVPTANNLTPLSHRNSYGSYSAPNFLKNKNTTDFRERELAYNSKVRDMRAPVLVDGSGNAILNGFNDPISKKIGRDFITARPATIKLTRCEWSNFFQSLSYLPRFVLCQNANNESQLSSYISNKNLGQINFIFHGTGDSLTRTENYKFVVLSVAGRKVEATACEWYNLVQTEYRWPNYRECLPNPDQPSYNVKTVKEPKPDFYVRDEPKYNN
jgi:hypothetical protein